MSVDSSFFFADEIHLIPYFLQVIFINRSSHIDTQFTSRNDIVPKMVTGIYSGLTHFIGELIKAGIASITPGQRITLNFKSNTVGPAQQF